MDSYGKTKGGIVFRVQHDRPLTLDTITALHKLAELASKHKFTKKHGQAKEEVKISVKE